jgi:subtilisin family serine protease
MHTRYLGPLWTLLLLAIPLTGVGQPLTQAQKEKLDPKLQSVLARHLPDLEVDSQAPAAAAVSAAPSTASKQGTEIRYGVFVQTGDNNPLGTTRNSMNSRFSTVATARVTPAQLADLARAPGVRYVRAAGQAHPTSDVASGLTGIDLLRRGGLNNTSYGGEGTLTCIIDSGIDWSHRDFRDLSDSTRSRVLAIWDQTLQPQSGEDSPADRSGSDFSGLTYGVEYTQSDIEDEIDGTPASGVRSQDVTGHGTHVTGTAAGNGGALEPRQNIGMAPDASIVVVKAGDESFPMTNVIDGMNYCGTVSDRQGKPLVINMSLGTESGPHDGSSFTDQAVNSFLTNDNTGKIVVTSAGNNGDVNMHYDATLSVGDSADVSFEIPSYSPKDDSDNDRLALDVWFDDNAETRADVYAGDSLLLSQAPGGSDTKATGLGTVYIENDISSLNSDRNISVEIYDGSASAPPAVGEWTVRLVNTSNASTSFHGWLYEHNIGEEETVVTVTGGDAKYTVNSPGTAEKAITVGAYVHRWLWRTENGDDLVYSNDTNPSDDISPFSSRGPRRDGLQILDLTAPGQGIIASLSADAPVADSRIMSGSRHSLNQGTSMSAPVVSGAIALFLQENGSLSPAQVASALTTTARADDYTNTTPNNIWGHGKLDAFAALASIAGISSERELIRYDVWTTGSYPTTTVTSDEKLALNFSPSIGGHLPGVMVHTFSTVRLSDSLHVELWTDNGSGAPGSPVGSGTTIAPDEIVPVSWNYLKLETDGPPLTQGASYHVILSPTGSSDTLSVLAEWDGVTTGRSRKYSGGSWSSLTTDLHIRPEIGPAASSSGVGTNRLARTELPARFGLSSNFPNPFNPSTAIPYTVPEQRHVTLAIYNLLGQKIRTLVDERHSPGRYRVRFDASELPSGVYFYRLEAGSYTQTRSMTLLK